MSDNKDTEFKFSKFIDDIVEREEKCRQEHREHARGQEELPQRRYNRLYRELWQNRIKYRRKK